MQFNHNQVGYPVEKFQLYIKYKRNAMDSEWRPLRDVKDSKEEILYELINMKGAYKTLATRIKNNWKSKTFEYKWCKLTIQSKIINQ